MLDLLIIGAGVNGAGIARDAAGRGLKVALIDRGDLAGGTSSASTKLIHGGLRYLEQYEFRLVAKALAERETILAIAPHIAWPLPFLLPHAPGLRPRWMLRAGLFLYDHLARRREVPGSAAVRLAPAQGLKPGYRHGFRYWDGWVDDARLVVLNARDAAARGCAVHLRAPIRAAALLDGAWRIELATGVTLRARHVVNAAGPWAGEVARGVLGLADAPAVRLVQGAHLVTRRVDTDGDALILQGPDRRIVFVIPYGEHTLVGTTERALDDADRAEATPEEEAYLLAAANRYLARPLTPADVVHRFAGVRPLVEEAGVSAREATRDWRLIRHARGAATTVVGGKLTTYRLLARAVVDGLAPASDWTAAAPLPGGGVAHVDGSAVRGFDRFLADLLAAHRATPAATVRRLARAYGTEAEPMLARPGRDLGGVTEAELTHLAQREWAATAEDALWRRTKLGLTLPPGTVARVRNWFGET